MADSRKTKAQLLEEVKQLRIRVKNLEQAEQYWICAERELRESKAITRVLLNTPTDNVFLIARDYKILDMNKSAAQSIGVRADKLFAPREDSPLFYEVASSQKAIIDSVFQSGKPARFAHEQSGIGQDTIVYPVFDDSGIVTKAALIMQDITESKRFEIERETLQRLSRKLAGPLSVKEIGRIIAQESLSLFNHDAFALALYNEDKKILHGIYNEDTALGDTQPREILETEDFPFSTLQDGPLIEGKSRLIDRSSPEQTATLIPFGFKDRISQSLMFCPIRWKEETVGLLTVQSYTPKRYDENQLELLQSFANQIGGAIARIKAEESRHESESLLESVFHAIQDGICIVDTDLNIIQTNEAMKTWYPHEVPFEGKKCYQAFQGRTEVCTQCPSIRALETGQLQRETVPFTKPDGISGWFALYAFPILDSSGQANTVVKYIRNITEQKQAEEALQKAHNELELRVQERTAELSLINDQLRNQIHVRKQTENALRQSEARYNLASSAGRVGIWDLDLKTKEFFIDPNLKALLGYKDHETKNQFESWSKHFHHEERPDFVAKWENFFIDPPPHFEVEHRMVHKDGSIHWFITRGMVYKNQAGEPIRVVGTDLDITDHKLAENARIESERKYRTLFERVEDGIYITTREGVFLEANKAFQDLLGYTWEELKQLMGLKIYANPRDRQKFQKAIEARGSIQDYELRLKRKDGKEIDCIEAASVWWNPDGSLGGYQGLIRDITSKKRADEEKRRLEQLRRDFVGNVSHEFKTPLTAIRGYAETLLDKALEDKDTSRRFVTIILNQAIRLQRLTNNLLKLSQLDEGSLDVEFQPVDIPVLIKFCIETIRLKAQQKKLTLNIDCPSTLPQVRGDAWWLRQVIQNLLDNAVEYTPPGGRISVWTSAGQKDVEVSVSDNGIGIPKDKLPFIFDRFYRIDSSRSGKSGGTGLGLSIVKDLVEAHEGRIQVESELGNGTTFSVFLPRMMT